MIMSFTQDDAGAHVLFTAKNPLKLDPEATYLIVGGLDGLDRRLAMEFVASGARHIAFLSRSGERKPKAKAVVDQLAAHGA
jgi:zearalenone synthase (highly reducing iterative type I polyketide synthase)